MTPSTSIRVARVLRFLLLLVGAGFVVTWLVIVFLRIGYPFDLEWMEGGSVDHVARILRGEKLFVAPTLEFVPYIYNPLYYYLGAGVAKLTGLGYLPLRGVSFLASLGSLIVIFALVRRETESAFAGALSACLFAATYQVSGTWFDLARVDSLFLFFLLCGIHVLRAAASISSYVLAALLVYLAFMTKQTTLVIALPLMLYAVLQGGRRGLAFAAAVVVPSVATVAVLDALHDGWYTYYAFELPRRHELEPEMFLGFWVRDILLPVAISVGLGVFYLLAAWAKGRRDAVRFYALLAVGMIGAAWLSRLHSGGAENVLIPAHAALAILLGLAVHRGVGLVRERGAGRWLECALYGICLLQFFLLTYTPSATIPSSRDREAGVRFVQALSRIDGEVFIGCHPSLATMAAKKSAAHAMAMKDVLRGREDAAQAALAGALASAIAERRFAAVILSTDDVIAEPFLSRYYTRGAAIFSERDLFWPVAGYKNRPELIYYPKR